MDAFHKLPPHFTLKKALLMTAMLINMALVFVIVIMPERFASWISDELIERRIEARGPLREREMKNFRKTVLKICLGSTAGAIVFQFLFFMGIIWKSICLCLTYASILVSGQIILVILALCYPALSPPIWAMIGWQCVVILLTGWFSQDLRQIERLQTHPLLMTKPFLIAEAGSTKSNSSSNSSQIQPV